MAARHAGKMPASQSFGAGRDEHAVEHAHESPRVMWMPLAVLAFFATVIGLVNAPGIGFLESFVGAGGVLGIKEPLEVTAFDPPDLA